jgi:hypothetical protein
VGWSGGAVKTGCEDNAFAFCTQQDGSVRHLDRLRQAQMKPGGMRGIRYYSPMAKWHTWVM